MKGYWLDQLVDDQICVKVEGLIHLRPQLQFLQHIKAKRHVCKTVETTMSLYQHKTNIQQKIKHIKLE